MYNNMCLKIVDLSLCDFLEIQEGTFMSKLTINVFTNLLQVVSVLNCKNGDCESFKAAKFVICTRGI